ATMRASQWKCRLNSTPNSMRCGRGCWRLKNGRTSPSVCWLSERHRSRDPDGTTVVGPHRAALRYPLVVRIHRAQGAQMITREDVQAYLDRLDLPVEPVADDMWLVRTGEGGAELAVHLAPPVLVMRVKVMQLPADPARSGELCRRLLELNARDLIH